MFHCFNVELFSPAPPPPPPPLPRPRGRPPPGQGTRGRNIRASLGHRHKGHGGVQGAAAGTVIVKVCLAYITRIKYCNTKKAFCFTQKCSAFAGSRLRVDPHANFPQAQFPETAPFPLQNYTDTSSSSSWDKTTMPFPLNGDEKGTPGESIKASIWEEEEPLLKRIR